MFHYFKYSFLFLIIGLIAAYLWGDHRLSGSGFLCMFIVIVLAILEVSLSFDNAVVNAMKLQKMSKIWQHRFLTWGILVAVFGMRLLFPIAIVSIFAGISLVETAMITINDVDKYTFYLTKTHAPVLAFGGCFLLMLYFHYFFNENKQLHWIRFLEDKMSKFGDIKGLEAALALICLYITQLFLPDEIKINVILSGIIGVVLYVLIHGLSLYMESHAPKQTTDEIHQTFKAGLISFLYLELIDASFSLDGVLGAFALSKDIIIITLGLAIGAMFVRSFTIMLVEKKTLQEFPFLEHGAHWAIGALAIIMLYSTIREVPEVITGLIGLVFIVFAIISSILYNKKSKGNL